MKTKMLKLTVIMLLMAGSFSACKEKGNDNSPYTLKAYSNDEETFYLNENEYITMRVLPDRAFNKSEIKIEIKNHTKYTLGYGYDFFLEYFDHENWTRIDLNIAFQRIGLGIKPYETTFQRINFSETTEGMVYLSDLPEHYLDRLGRYRIIKNFCFPPTFNLNVIDLNFDLKVEFEILQNY